MSTFLIDQFVNSAVEKWLKEKGHEVVPLEDLKDIHADRVIITDQVDMAIHITSKADKPCILILSSYLKDKEQHLFDRLQDLIETRSFMLSPNTIIVLDQGRDRIGQY